MDTTINLPGSLKSKLHVFIKYWVSSVSVIKSILSGRSSTLRLSNSSTWRSTLHIWNIKIDGAPSSQQVTWDLSIKRVVMEQIGAMKLLAVSLGHCDYVLISSEYLNLGNTSLLQKCEGMYLFNIFLYLICHFWSTSGKVTLSFDWNFGSYITIFSQSIYFDSFIIISIVKDNVRDPNQADLIFLLSQSSFIDITRTLKCSIFQN